MALHVVFAASTKRNKAPDLMAACMLHAGLLRHSLDYQGFVSGCFERTAQVTSMLDAQAALIGGTFVLYHAPRAFLRQFLGMRRARPWMFYLANHHVQSCMAFLVRDC